MDTAFIFLYLAGLVLIGLFSTRLMKLIRMPNVTGFILAGILMGPYVFGLIFSNHHAFTNDPAQNPILYYVNHLSWVSNLALCFIAFSIGSSFKGSTLKAVGKRVLVITVLEALMASLLVIGALLALHFIFPDHIGLPLVFTLAAIAAATAPAATLMVIKQYKARGPVVSTLLPVVALDDAAALILFSILFQIAKINATGTSFDLYSMLGKPLIEIAISLAIGTLLGFAMSFATKIFLSRANRTGWVIFIAFGALGFGALFKQPWMGGFELSSLLLCMMAGAIYANFGHGRSKTFEFLDRFTSPLYMLFFLFSGASLDLTIFASSQGLVILGVAAAYLAFRVIGKCLGAGLGATITKAEPTVRKYMGFCLVPQAGVAIGLSTSAGASFAESGQPAVGALVVAVVLTSTLVYELIGPLATKAALSKAGEIPAETPPAPYENRR